MRRSRPSTRRPPRSPRTLVGSLLTALVPAVALYVVSYPLVAVAVTVLVLSAVVTSYTGQKSTPVPATATGKTGRG